MVMPALPRTEIPRRWLPPLSQQQIKIVAKLWADLAGSSPAICLALAQSAPTQTPPAEAKRLWIAWHPALAVLPGNRPAASPWLHLGSPLWADQIPASPLKLVSSPKTSWPHCCRPRQRKVIPHLFISAKPRSNRLLPHLAAPAGERRQRLPGTRSSAEATALTSGRGTHLPAAQTF